MTSNQLAHVTDTDPAGNYTDDIDNQTAGNYDYDNIGNLIKDNAEGITGIEWTVYGKIKQIKKETVTINYSYDVSGNRVSKELIGAPGGTTKQFYIRDAQGNTMAIYNGKTSYVEWAEQHLYGSSRLGIWNYGKANPAVPGAVVYDSMMVGSYNYELTNHLGNVLSTISDKKVGISAGKVSVDYYNAEVVNQNDYYAFGSLMPGRKYSVANTNYRYGFNGQEKDNDIEGDGNAYDFGERIQDPRLGGRWFSVDPLASKMPGWSPYSFAFNSPISHADYKGLYPILTVTNQITGYTAIKVYGKTGNPIIIVPTYKAILKDVTNGKTTVLATYNVTRDGYYNIGSKKNEIKLEDRSFEPKKEVTYTGVKFDYVEGTPALALRQNGSQKLDATPLNNHTYIDGTQLPRDIDRKEPTIATGVMIHIGGAYEHQDGTVTISGTYGCMGVVSSDNVYNTKTAAQNAINDGSYMSNTSNSTIKDLSKKMDDSNAKDPAPNKIEVIIKKRK